ncbi:MAG: SEC-C domain-containing protein [Parachlamydiaceae bacterium]|nr:SEC-C domain-containing protein [Parachlamydiaceae bacterium]
MPLSSCPCCSGLTYAECCRSFHVSVINWL